MPVPTPVGVSGPGFLFQISDTSGVNYTTLALQKDLAGPDATMGKVDVSTQDMTGRTRLYDPELVEPGTITGTLIFRADNATHAAMFANLKVGQFLNYKRYLDTAGTHYFSGSGFFSKFAPKSPVGGPQTADVEFQTSGEAIFN